jgi:acyl phosphate:glycerol-3-phosphate acyltransferase
MPDLLGDFTYTWPFALGLLGGYFLGSIPVGLLLTRLAGLGDIRNIGSGNIGATNVLRTGKKGIAALTMALDIGKATAAVLIAQQFGPDMAILAAVGALLGHMFPIWLKFQGGKGVAASLGVMLGLAWPVGVILFSTWLLVLAVLRISSLAALTGAAVAPVAAKVFASPQVFEFSLFMTAMVIIRHRENLVRLVQGKEPKIGGSKKDGEAGKEDGET